MIHSAKDTACSTWYKYAIQGTQHVVHSILHTIHGTHTPNRTRLGVQPVELQAAQVTLVVLGRLRPRGRLGVHLLPRS